METITADTLNTQLSDRVLWFDGCSTFASDDIFSRLGKYDVKYVDKLTPEITQYNRTVGISDRLLIKTINGPLSVDWVLPESIMNLNLLEYFSSAHAILAADMDESEIEAREVRLVQELNRYSALGFDYVLRALIWVISMLTKRNIVWGVGRGSSVASYALYIIGVHDVDSFAYELDVDQFLRD